jgi:hypothetical protein
MNDLEGKSRSVDGIEELQTGWLAVGLAGTNLHGLAALGNAEDGIADDACVVEAPRPSMVSVSSAKSSLTASSKPKWWMTLGGRQLSKSAWA